MTGLAEGLYVQNDRVAEGSCVWDGVGVVARASAALRVPFAARRGAVHNLTYDGFTVRSRAPPPALPLWMDVPSAEAPAFAGMTRGRQE